MTDCGLKGSAQSQSSAHVNNLRIFQYACAHACTLATVVVLNEPAVQQQLSSAASPLLLSFLTKTLGTARRNLTRNNTQRHLVNQQRTTMTHLRAPQDSFALKITYVLCSYQISLLHTFFASQLTRFMGF